MDDPPARTAPSSLERIAEILLSVATLSVLSTGVLAVGWWRAAHERVELAELSEAERQELVSEMITVSPGVFSRPWYEPRIGYTLRPGESADLGFDTFTANELGYRTGPAEKPPGTFRVVFVGDSWTFGTGVREAESYAKVFEKIANRRSGLDRQIEAWTLALAGYNTVNQLAAFWFFVERLQPDAVVIAPSSNDNHSGNEVLPNGSLSRFGKTYDHLGDPHPVAYRVPVDSFRYRSRWRLAFQMLRETEDQLRELGIPLMFYFVARWPPAAVHARVEEAGLRSPYLITPWEYLFGKWLNPKPHGHGTPQANEIYGRMVYQGLASTLGWPTLPPADEGSDVEIFERPPGNVDWKAQDDARLARLTRRYVPESFRPGKDAPERCSGPIHPFTGVMGRATTVLVRYREGARSLDVGLQRLEGTRYLYPLSITVSIPSASGGTRRRATVPAGGPDLHRFTVEIPTDVRPGQALDVVFEASRMAAGVGQLHGRSIRIRSIEQSDVDLAP